MDTTNKARLVEEGGKIANSLLRLAISRPRKYPSKAEEEQTSSVTPEIQETTARTAPQTRLEVSLPTTEETTVELKRRLARELYKAELDLAAGLKIAGKPCDCLEDKHTLMLEAASEELISQDPSNSVYQDVIQWIKDNQHKVTIEAVDSGNYATEYPYMSKEFKNFRKRVMGSVGLTESPAAHITLEEAKKLAAEEAAKEVERKWKSVSSK